VRVAEAIILAASPRHLHPVVFPVTEAYRLAPAGSSTPREAPCQRHYHSIRWFGIVVQATPSSPRPRPCIAGAFLLPRMFRKER